LIFKNRFSLRIAALTVPAKTTAANINGVNISGRAAKSIIKNDQRKFYVGH